MHIVRYRESASLNAAVSAERKLQMKVAVSAALWEKSRIYHVTGMRVAFFGFRNTIRQMIGPSIRVFEHEKANSGGTAQRKRISAVVPFYNGAFLFLFKNAPYIRDVRNKLNIRNANIRNNERMI